MLHEIRPCDMGFTRKKKETRGAIYMYFQKFKQFKLLHFNFQAVYGLPKSVRQAKLNISKFRYNTFIIVKIKNKNLVMTNSETHFISD